MRTVAIVLVLLVGFLLICGCTQSGETVNTPGVAQPTVQQTAVPSQQPSPTVLAASSAPRYQPGDIIYGTPTNGDPCWLIISYDQNTDEYETAVVFKYKDGSWGYLLDEDTDWDKRDFIEKYYPVHITHVDLSNIGIGYPSSASSSATQTPDPKYRSGDVIDEAPTNADPCWVILAYDPRTDEYEKDVIFKHKDGTWGYRLDADTKWSGREFTEKYYPALIAHVDPRNIKIGYQY